MDLEGKKSFIGYLSAIIVIVLVIIIFIFLTKPKHLPDNTLNDSININKTPNLPTIKYGIIKELINSSDLILKNNLKEENFIYQVLGASNFTYHNQSTNYIYPTRVYDIAVSPDGKVYIADLSSSRILSYYSNLSFKRVEFSAPDIGIPEGIAVDNNETLYLIDKEHTIKRYNPKSKYYLSFPLNYKPISIEVDNKGNMYVIENSKSDYRLHIYNKNFKEIKTLDKYPATHLDIKPKTFGRLKDIAIDNKGNLILVDELKNQICKFSKNLTFKKCINGFLSKNITFGQPTGIAVDSQDRIYIVDNGNSRIIIVNNSLNYITSLKDNFYDPQDIDIDKNGNIYIADQGNIRVVVYYKNLSLKGIIQGKSLSELAPQFSPRGIAIDNDSIYVTDGLGGGIIVFNKSYDIVNSKFGFYKPRSIKIGPNNKIYVVDRYNHRVQIFYKNLTYKATIGGKKGSGKYEFSEPRGVAIAKDGRIYIADTNNARIQVYYPNGSYLDTLSIKKGKEYSFKEPRYLDIDNKGNLYVVDVRAMQVKEFSKNLTYITTINLDPFLITPRHIKIIDKIIYIVDLTQGSVIAYNLSSKTFSTVIKNLSAPRAITYEHPGYFYVGDVGSSRINIYDSNFNLIKSFAPKNTVDVDSLIKYINNQTKIKIQLNK